MSKDTIIPGDSQAKFDKLRDKLVGNTVKDVDFIDDDKTMELTFMDGIVFRIWAQPWDDEYPELDYEYQVQRRPV